jgi:hypothetical protein
VHHLVRIGLLSLVGWQATAAAIEHGRQLVASRPDWRQALLASTEERVRNTMGGNADLVDCLPPLLPDGAMVFHRAMPKDLEELRRSVPDEQQLIAVSQQLAARNGWIMQARALLFPRVLLVTVPTPIDLAERTAANGRASWLLTIDEEPTPADRAGWSRVHTTPAFVLWRCQPGS